jgi:hypothetical protein
MSYDEIIATVSEIVNNEHILTKGLTLIYELDIRTHKQVDEELYIKMNGNLDGFEHQDIIEIEVEGTLVKFIPTGTKIEFDLD